MHLVLSSSTQRGQAYHIILEPEYPGIIGHRSRLKFPDLAPLLAATGAGLSDPGNSSYGQVGAETKFLPDGFVGHLVDVFLAAGLGWGQLVDAVGSQGESLGDGTEFLPLYLCGRHR
jgi:hypothetical protein